MQLGPTPIGIPIEASICACAKYCCSCACCCACACCACCAICACCACCTCACCTCCACACASACACAYASSACDECGASDSMEARDGCAEMFSVAMSGGSAAEGSRVSEPDGEMTERREGIDAEAKGSLVSEPDGETTERREGTDAELYTVWGSCSWKCGKCSGSLTRPRAVRSLSSSCRSLRLPCSPFACRGSHVRRPWNSEANVVRPRAPPSWAPGSPTPSGRLEPWSR
ncbi:hypothetical protein T492DRAFT_999442 [Pavlovales sp. CCMP2436]|nr:hypothetical protein T492DRAFT_999442 [Pavlovales sp. CCMP2436]